MNIGAATVVILVKYIFDIEGIGWAGAAIILELHCGLC